MTPDPNLLRNVVYSILYSAIGVGAFVLSFVVVDRLTPYNLWKEVCENKNVAVSILVGSCAIALGMIVAASIH